MRIDHLKSKLPSGDVKDNANYMHIEFYLYLKSNSIIRLTMY